MNLKVSNITQLLSILRLHRTLKSFIVLNVFCLVTTSLITGGKVMGMSSGPTPVTIEHQNITKPLKTLQPTQHNYQNNV